MNFILCNVFKLLRKLFYFGKKYFKFIKYEIFTTENLDKKKTCKIRFS